MKCWGPKASKTTHAAHCLDGETDLFRWRISMAQHCTTSDRTGREVAMVGKIGSGCSSQENVLGKADTHSGP